MKLKPVISWAWAIRGWDSRRNYVAGQYELCYWLGSREELLAEGKPSPEAKLVRVRLATYRPRRKRKVTP